MRLKVERAGLSMDTAPSSRLGPPETPPRAQIAPVRLNSCSTAPKHLNFSKSLPSLPQR